MMEVLARLVFYVHEEGKWILCFLKKNEKINKQILVIVEIAGIEKLLEC